MPNWKELRHAYGSAEDIPRILSALTPDSESPAWTDLWSRVCHQGTTYSSSPAVLPFLVNVASNWSAADRVMPLALAGSIVSAPQTVLDHYEGTVDALRTLALDTVKNPALTRNDRVCVMQAVLAFEGDRLWGRVLDHLNDGEFPGSCPGCRKELHLVVGRHGAFVTSSDWFRNPKAAKAEINPPELGTLPAVGCWLYAVSTDSNDSELSNWIRCLFGASKCPECGRPFNLPEAIAEIEED